MVVQYCTADALKRHEHANAFNLVYHLLSTLHLHLHCYSIAKHAKVKHLYRCHTVGTLFYYNWIVFIFNRLAIFQLGTC